MLALVAATAACVWAFFRFHQGDPSEWRENYLGELAKREDVEKELHLTQVALAAEQAAKDITPLLDAITNLTHQQQRSEERLTKRLEAFEKSNQQQAEILTSLVDAVLGVNKAPGRRREAA